MGTRGLNGFYKNGVSKLTYNHFDSYPEELGVNILEEVRNVGIDKLNKCFDNIIMVESDSKPTKEQIEECKQFHNKSVSTGEVTEWYSLLREVQGSLKPYIIGKMKYMIDNQNFITNSLFCEWCYIINLDTNKFEVWQGFQQTPQNGNRYGDKVNDGYYPCKLLTEFDLNNLPTEEKFLEVIKMLTELE